MRKDLLVTLADGRFLDQAKQVFSSAYLHSGWRGDYMLLAHEVPMRKLAWFKEKGILVRRCKPIIKGIGMPLAVYADKFYLFTEEFKQWRTVIYLDADTMVNASLDALTCTRGFSAPDNSALAHRIISPINRRIMKIDPSLVAELEQEHDLGQMAFCSGIMVFSTDIIRQDSFPRLVHLFTRYGQLSAGYEELILNLMYNKRRIPLPIAYAVVPFDYSYQGRPASEIEGIIHHFCVEKPWIAGAPLAEQWSANLAKADRIDLDHRPAAARTWTPKQIVQFEKRHKQLQALPFTRNMLGKIQVNAGQSIDRSIGLVVFVSQASPPSGISHGEEDEMRGSVLVTLASGDYLDQAKQLFSSAHWNAGWKGEYLLLAYRIPERRLKWFRDKGILVKHCGPFADDANAYRSLMTAKFHLFTEEFKQWEHVVYLDADIIVRGPLDALAKVERFAAVEEDTLADQFMLSHLSKGKAATVAKLKRSYDLREARFNSGVMAFPGSTIKAGIAIDLRQALIDYRSIILFDDQPLLNLAFYKRWQRLPLCFNAPPYRLAHPYAVRDTQKVPGIVLHFIGKRKPWHRGDPFYREWKRLLAKAERIDVHKPVKAAEWSDERILHESRRIRTRMIAYTPIRLIDQLAGLVGIRLRKWFPRLSRRIG